MEIFYFRYFLFLTIIYGTPACLVYLAVRRARAEKGVMTPGLKGWLFILAIFIWAVPLRLLAELNTLVTGHADPPQLRYLDGFMLGCGLTTSVICLVLMMKHSRFFPRAFYVLILWNIISLPLSIILSALVLGAHRGVAVSPSVMLAAALAGARDWGGSLAAGVAWAVYVRRSRRVALTFVR